MGKLPSMVKAEIAKMPPDKQEHLVEEFRRKSKSMGITYVLWLFGFHYAYLGKLGWLLLYWLTFGGLLIWTIIDLFRIPGMVGTYNKDVAVDVLRDLKIITG
jgi:energy-converting hydrogenase Eha subunit G